MHISYLHISYLVLPMVAAAASNTAVRPDATLSSPAGSLASSSGAAPCFISPKAAQSVSLSVLQPSPVAHTRHAMRPGQHCTPR